MTETFVDLTYRGLSLGRRIKLTQVRATSGYLEHPTPMPVGTAVAITTDDGIVIDAVVEAIREQVGGSDTPPGMQVKPALASEQLAGWWNARAQAAAAPAPAPAAEPSSPVTVRPRSHTIPEPSPAAALATGAPTFTSAVDGYAPTPHAPTPAVALPMTTIPGTVSMPPPMTTIPGTVFDPAPRGGSSTTVMNAVDQELLAQLTKSDDIEQITRRSGEHAIVDDGMRTSVMDAVDPAALGLDVSMLSGTPEETEEEDDHTSPTEVPLEDKKPPKGSSSGPTKKRKKRR